MSRMKDYEIEHEELKAENLRLRRLTDSYDDMVVIQSREISSLRAENADLRRRLAKGLANIRRARVLIEGRFVR